MFPKHSKYALDKVSFCIENYELFISELGQGRGVAIYTHRSLQANGVKIFNDIEYEESVWCTVKLHAGDQLLIGCIYRSPNSNDINNNKLNTLMKNAADAKFSHILIGGDFNYKEINWIDKTTNTAIDHESSIFLECILDSYLTQHVTSPTRFRQNQTESTLDLIFTNEEGMINQIKTLPAIGASDHVVLSFELLCYSPSEGSSSPKSSFFKGDYVAMRENLTNHNWEFDKCTNVDDMWRNFETKVNDLIKDYVPVKTTKQAFRKQWMTVETASVIDKKRRAWTRYLNCKSYENKQLYTSARNIATNTIRYAKRDYERKIALQSKDEPKVFWSYVRKNTKTREQIGDLKQEDGKLTHDPKNKANILNNFFSSVFTRENLDNMPNLESRNQGKSLHNIVISTEIIKKNISKLKQAKSPGPDGIHNKLIIELKEQISEPLCKIFQESIDSGRVPIEWKCANVSPIYKSGDKHEPGNYRPVSLTSICSRLLESIIKGQIMEYMEKNDMFSEHQYGFRSGYSCVTQLLHIFEEWSASIDDNKAIDVIYLDFRKAFDTVPHKRLINKLKAYGIQGKITSWIENFLSDRKQRVSIDGQFSDWADVSSGIPQGSVLGPTLFLIFINDLPDKVRNLVKIFADDTKIYSTINNNEDIDSLQQDLDNLSEWSNTWKLGFNAKKCKSMHIGYRNDRHTYTMLDAQTGERTEIEQVDEEKDLGVYFQSDLKFTKQINCCVNKANRMIGIIKRNFSSLDKETFLILYKSLIRPYMEYATTVWSPYLKKDIFALENAQRRATKLVPSIREKPYEERLLELGLPTLNYRRQRNDMIQVYKIMNQIDKLDKDLFFKLSSASQTRGHNLKLQKTHNRLNLRANAFSQRVINHWNNLSESCVKSKNVNCFKSNLNDYWKNHPDKFHPNQNAHTQRQYSKKRATRGRHFPRENQRPGYQ